MIEGLKVLPLFLEFRWRRGEMAQRSLWWKRRQSSGRMVAMMEKSRRDHYLIGLENSSIQHKKKITVGGGTLTFNYYKKPTLTY
ncbi:hypothetical protein LXL04_004369 [Taraxacum kok-saghyz]